MRKQHLTSVFNEPEADDLHCARCGYGWGSYSGAKYRRDMPCPGCGTEGAVCGLPAGHREPHEEDYLVSSESAAHPDCPGSDELHCAGCITGKPSHCKGVDGQGYHCNGCPEPPTDN
jgi:hypothetical protein